MEEEEEEEEEKGELSETAGWMLWVERVWEGGKTCNLGESVDRERVYFCTTREMM